VSGGWKNALDQSGKVTELAPKKQQTISVVSDYVSITYGMVRFDVNHEGRRARRGAKFAWLHEHETASRLARRSPFFVLLRALRASWLK
jgi:hypothetical protein